MCAEVKGTAQDVLDCPLLVAPKRTRDADLQAAGLGLGKDLDGLINRQLGKAGPVLDRSVQETINAVQTVSAGLAEFRGVWAKHTLGLLHIGLGAVDEVTFLLTDTFILVNRLLYLVVLIDTKADTALGPFRDGLVLIDGGAADREEGPHTRGAQ